MKRILIVILLVLYVQFNAFAQKDRSFDRNRQLSRGINISWLENYWNPKVLQSKPISYKDFELIRKLGFTTIRLPVDFERFYLNGSEAEQTALMTNIENVILNCRQFGIHLILVNHYGTLRKETYQRDSGRLLQLWGILEKKYRKISTESLYFEILNEPTINDALWLPLAEKVIAAIRKYSPDRTIIIGASNFNSIYELSRVKPLSAKNVIYTFHFYEPFVFTHQGAEWVGKQVSTKGIPFPYTAGSMPPISPLAMGTAGEKNYNNYKNEGKQGAISDKLQIVAGWALKNHVPLLCGEYGAYRKYITDDDLANYLLAVRSELDVLKIPGIIWDYNQDFSIFKQSADINNLSPRMRKAIGYIP
ncbi:glycoside hydrolase family 5 protein [Pedobacter frigidisoli]|uniref:glycoside hydrolase family 5 protein n=1 Tax=Pedobacter frigidisoli TaxID=2530455 RepID=UPI0029313B28|nr:cellulase family glycosylhydrolase [Pedobacter frigidisoli]